MGPISDDNMMLVLLTDVDGRGYTVGWSPTWIEKCRHDPARTHDTMQAIGSALETFAHIMATPETNQVPVVPPNKTMVN